MAARAKADAKATEDDHAGEKRKGKGKVESETDRGTVDEGSGEKGDKHGGEKDPAKWQMHHMSLAETRFMATAVVLFDFHRVLVKCNYCSNVATSNISTGFPEVD